MAQIVAVMALAHAPGVTGWLSSAPPEEQAAIKAGFETMGNRLRACKPDVIVGIANDHMLNLPLHSPPDFCVGTASEWIGPAEFFRDWLHLDEYAVKGHPRAAAAIAARAKADGVRISVSDELLFDDNWSVPLKYLTPAYDVALVPLHMNCLNPPLAGPHDNYKVGAAIARAVREDLPEDLRVAIIGTGGLSHEPGGKRYFQVDEEFDRWFLFLLETGDVPRILREATVERMEQAGEGGTVELQAWLVALAAARNKVAERIFYVPSLEMRCGIGGVIWDCIARC
jgi:aromatic ring-opening dioxygenase catalytic subunit (LigB family)